MAVPAEHSFLSLNRASMLGRSCTDVYLSQDTHLASALRTYTFIQHSPHFVHQSVQAEGLGEKRHAAVKHAMAGNRAGSIT